MQIGLCTLIFAILLPSISFAADFSLEVLYTPSEATPYNLSYSLINNTKSAATIRESYLPWSIGVFEPPIAVYSTSPVYSRVPEIFAIADYVGEVLIAPGEAVRGELDLRHRFPEIAKANKKSEIVVMWFWRPIASGNVEHEPIAGSLIISKRK